MTDVVETARRDVVVVDETTVEVIELLVQGPPGHEGQQGPAGSGGSSGPAGGVLSGTYPNPGFAVDMATQDELDTERLARIAADAILSTAVGQKQDAATAATDLAAEATARSGADTTLTAAAAAAQSTANAALPKAGGTMTGDIVLAGDPTANLHPVTLQKLNAAIAALINSAPGTLDTLGEIAAALAADESTAAALASTVAGKLAKASNLGDLASVATAKTNLGLGSAADHPATDFATAAQGTDTRTPTAHKTTHATGGSDALAASDIGAQAASARLAELAALNTNATVPEQVGGVWVARSMASLKTDLALVKGDVGLGSVTNDAQVKAADRPTAVLASDVGPITSQTVLQDITGLGIAIGASATEVWRVTWWLLVNTANATMKAKFGLTVPTGCTYRFGVAGGLTSEVAAWGARATTNTVVALASSGSLTTGSVAGVMGVPLTAVIFGGGTAGTVQPQYAQNVSDAGALKIDKGSLMEAVKVAS